MDEKSDAAKAAAILAAAEQVEAAAQRGLTFLKSTFPSHPVEAVIALLNFYESERDAADREINTNLAAGLGMAFHHWMVQRATQPRRPAAKA